MEFKRIICRTIFGLSILSIFLFSGCNEIDRKKPVFLSEISGQSALSSHGWFSSPDSYSSQHDNIVKTDHKDKPVDQPSYLSGQIRSVRLVADEFRENLDKHGQTKADFPVPKHIIDFGAQRARYVRLVINKINDYSYPCIDELEIFSPGGNENLALASRGAVAQASSALSGYAIHAVEHLNNGLYGNSNSWISDSLAPQWVQITLPETATVSRVILSRDRLGEFKDRVPLEIEVLVSIDGKQWASVVREEIAQESPIRSPSNWSSHIPRLKMPVDRLSEKSWDGFLQYAFLRERSMWSDIPANDHLSPLIIERPAVPGGKPYWGRIARLEPLERVLVLFEEMIDRLAGQGLDVSVERSQAAGLRQRATLEADSEALYLEARHAKRDLFFRDPALEPIESILFAKRHPFLESHNYSEHLDGLLEPGGGVYVLHIPRDNQDRFRPDRASIEQLFDGSKGIVREPALDFDARTVYFAYRPDEPLVDNWESYWHLYAMEADGTGLRKLTDGPFHDFDAVVLPDGGLAFHTTRSKIRFLCWRPQAYVLYRMESDGTNMKRLSYANLTEWKPSVMSDGRIMWTRSEYQDKGADFGHTLWAIRPDGTHPELVFGNNTPNCYSQAHEVPGTDEIVTTLMSHGDHQGPIALIDRGKDMFDTGALTNITPETRPQYQMDRSHHNTFRDPYPVSADHFLVAHNPDNHHNWALYVIDRYGNREFLYADPLISSKRPSPFRARERPPVIPSTLNEDLKAQGLGQFVVQDVYMGLGPDVARGQVKYLRVSREVPATLEELSCGQYRSDHEPFQDFYPTPVHLVNGPAPSFLTRTTNAPLAPLRTGLNWSNQVKEVEPGLYRVTESSGWPSYVAKTSLGTVPVEEDGSASFLAPAGKVLYFHLLDGDYNEIQRMRSVIQLQPGELRSCIGCHEDRKMAPLIRDAIALKRPPRQLEPDPWGAEPFSYERVVQPVLDANCIRCHDGGKKDRPVLLGKIDRNRVPASYRALIEGGWVHFFDFSYGMRHFKAEPLSFGTLQSPLWDVLDDRHHKDIKLSETEMRALKTWIDLNCPLWPDYIYRLDRPAEVSYKADE